MTPVECNVCGHAKWHEIAKASLNPVALIQFIEGCPVSQGLGPRVIQYIRAVTGITKEAMDAALAVSDAHAAAREKEGE